jgi:SAM-dependent methyltransferase
VDGTETLLAARAYDALADRYDSAHPRVIDRAEDDAVARLVGPLVREVVRECGYMADLACGTGWLLDRFPTLSTFSVGVDASPAMLARAKEKHPDAEWLLADVRSFAAGHFDLITSMFGGASYVEPDALVRSVARNLRSGGRFFLMGYAPAYSHRPSYILRGSGVPWIPWSRRFARRMFSGSAFCGVRVRSLWSRRIDALDGRAGRRTISRLARLEAPVAGLLGDAYWTIVTGTRA